MKQPSLRGVRRFSGVRRSNLFLCSHVYSKQVVKMKRFGCVETDCFVILPTASFLAMTITLSEI